MLILSVFALLPNGFYVNGVTLVNGGRAIGCKQRFYMVY